MAHFLLRNDGLILLLSLFIYLFIYLSFLLNSKLLHPLGLFLGSSSAINCVGAVYAARKLGKGSTIVTILCDSGQRHLTKFWNPDYLKEKDLTPMYNDLSFMDV